MVLELSLDCASDVLCLCGVAGLESIAMISIWLVVYAVLQRVALELRTRRALFLFPI